MADILIIGYGNLLRGDDAVGLHAARELERQFRDDPEVEIIGCQQLTPELADDISRCELVLFLDAAYGGEPGSVESKPVILRSDAVGFSHQADPAALVAAAEQLYGEVPAAFTITLTGWAFNMSNKLSRGAQLRLPELVRRAREIITAHRRQRPLTAMYRVQ